MRHRSTMRASLALLVGTAVAAAAAAITLAGDAIEATLSSQLHPFLAFLAATALLQLVGLKPPGGGTLSLSAAGLVGAAITLGAGPAMAIGVLTAVIQWARARGQMHRAFFDAANLALSAGAAGLVFQQVTSIERSSFVDLLSALLAGLAFAAVNIGLLCLAMALSEGRSPRGIWLERFHFARYHFLAYGGLGLLAASAYDRLGVAALVAFVLPPLLLALSMRDTLARNAATP